MLTKHQLLKLLVDVAAANDVAILAEDRNLPPEICKPSDRATIRGMAKIVQELSQSFDYSLSPEFQKDTEGKSASVVAMKRRFAADPVKRAELRRRFEGALGEILSGDEILRLLPVDKHRAVRNIIELAAGLGNADS
jgi:hypothetical protein